MERYLESTDLGNIAVAFSTTPYHNMRAVLPPLELCKKIQELALGAARCQLANKIEETTGNGRGRRMVPLPCWS